MTTHNDIFTLTGKEPGPTVAIFGGVHGNERAGIMTIDHLRQTLRVTKGTVHLVHANPLAIKKGVRFVEHNLNRLFFRGSDTGSKEGARAHVLMDLLDECDALLDLHSYPAPTGKAVAFAICEPPSLHIASLFGLRHVIHGFSGMEKGGSDGYMHSRGRIGICVELGGNEMPEKFLPLGIETALRFLRAFGCIEHRFSVPARGPAVSTLAMFHKKQAAGFRLARGFRTFDQVRAGEVLAYENGASIVAPSDGFVLFPTEKSPVGVEAFLFTSSVRRPS